MGFGLPAAIGAQLACPNRRVILVAGDGGFKMTGLELYTAATEKLPLICIIVNNSVLGMVQYIGPTMVFVQAFFLSHEPLGTTQVVCFILIWCAIALFVWDLLAKRQAARAA